MCIVTTGLSGTLATSEMEFFMTLVKGTKPITNVTKSSILDVARVPYTPPVIVLKFSLTRKFKKKESLNHNKKSGKQQQKI